jgi:tetratricopeptide (TPR) repeat protein
MVDARGLVAVLLCCLTLTASVPAAAADDRVRAKVAFEEGRKLFQVGDYREALAQFKQAFMYKEDAAFLLNIAQCHRFLGENKEALTLYRRYLKAVPEGESPEIRKVVENAIRDLESATAGPAPATTTVPGTPAIPTTAPTPAVQPPAAPVPVPQASTPSAPVPPAPLPEPPPASPEPLAPAMEIESPAAPLPSAPTEPPASVSGLRVAGVACAAVGLGSILAGVYYWTRATSLSDSVDRAETYNHSDYEQGARAEKMQWIFYSAGTAAVVAGVVLYLFGGSSPAALGQKVSVAPMLGPAAAGVLAGGTF